MNRRSLFAILSSLMVGGRTLDAEAAAAGTFPDKPISLIVPFGPGGATDIVARSLTVEGAAQLGQPFVVFNRPGASATLGTAEVFRARPDGYTLLLADNISTVLQPKRMKLPYQGARDFEPVIKVADIPNVLAVRADARWKTLADFVADAQSRPGSMRVSTAGQFTGTDLNIRELNHVGRMDTTPVPVSGGTGAAVTLLLGGHVEAVVASSAAIVSFVQGGKLRPLTVFAKRRISLFPDLPTTSEAGYETTMRVMAFVSAPKGLDSAVLEKLHGGLAAAIQSSRFRDFAARTGYQIDPAGPQALSTELEGWGKYFTGLLRQLGPEAPK